MESRKKSIIDPKDKAVMIGRVALDKKAEDVRILDLRGASSFCDYFVICSGHSTRHVQGIVRAIEESLGRKKISARGIEGLEQGHWVLLDYYDVVIHVFHSPVREFYDLEGLWSEAPTVAIEEQA